MRTQSSLWDIFIHSVNIFILQNWIDCKLNVKPLDELGRCIQINCYPQNYEEMTPYFCFDIDIMDVKCGPVTSRTRKNVHGIFWSHGEKRCKFFFAFENAGLYDAYTAYLKEMLQSLEKIQVGKFGLSDLCE